jgi:hypothetical protein
MTKKNDITHLETKIRTFEDFMIRSRNPHEIDKIRNDLNKMRIELQNMKYSVNNERAYI